MKGEFEEWRRIGMGVDFILTWTEGGVQQERDRES